MRLLRSTRSKVAAAFLAAAVLVGGSISIFVGPGPSTNTTPAGFVIPAVPTNEQICPGGADDASLQSPYSYDGPTTNFTTTFTSGEYGLPTYGTAGTDYPNVTQGYILGPSGWTAPQSYTVSPDTIYYFEPGTYTNFGQFQAATGDVFLGGYTAQTGGAVFDNGYSETDSQGIYGSNPSFTQSGGAAALTTLSAAATVGSTTITLAAPVQQWTDIAFADGTAYTVSAISGDTATLSDPISTAEANGASVYPEGSAGAVTVEYLTFQHFGNLATGVVTSAIEGALSGDGWTIEHNYFHDLYPGSAAGPSLVTTGGIGVYGGESATVEFNCFSHIGEDGMEGFGSDGLIAYNEFLYAPEQPDQQGCGCISSIKFWITTNYVISHNWIDDPGPGIPLWFDTDNTGETLTDNYIENSQQRAIQLEISYNALIQGNTFVDDGWVDGSTDGQYGGLNAAAIYINESGGLNIPGSNYNDQIIITHNLLIDDWQGIYLWGEADRNCLQPAPYNTYCSGYDHTIFSGWLTPSSGGDGPSSLTSAVSSGATSFQTSFPPAVDDRIGFSAAATTTTTDTTAVTSFSGSSIVNASTTGFPTSGEIAVATSNGGGSGDNDSNGTGAVLSYTGTTSTTFTGVSLVRGSGNLAGAIQEIYPYTVTSVTANGGNKRYYTVNVSPSLPAESAGTDLYGFGTCDLYDTANATPTSPMPPSGTLSYFDGCQWAVRNVTVAANTIDFSATDIQHGSSPWASLETLSNCYSGSSYTDFNSANPDACGANGMSYYLGSPAQPYNSSIMENALMSDSAFSGKLANLNAQSSPPGTTTNSEAAGDNRWYSNNYNGSQAFEAYVYGTCPGYAPYPCEVTEAQWKSDWQQG